MADINKIGQIDAEISWPKFFEFNKDTKYHPDGEYSCQAVFSKEAKDKLVNDYHIDPSRIEDLGNGSYQYKFKRRHFRSPTWEVGPPTVFDYHQAKTRMEAEEGTHISKFGVDWNPEEHGLIGNGTKAKIVFKVYKGPRSPNLAVYLEAVMVTDLVSYKSQSGDSSKVLF